MLYYWSYRKCRQHGKSRSSYSCFYLLLNLPWFILLNYLLQLFCDAHPPQISENSVSSCALQMGCWPHWVFWPALHYFVHFLEDHASSTATLPLWSFWVLESIRNLLYTWGGLQPAFSSAKVINRLVYPVSGALRNPTRLPERRHLVCLMVTLISLMLRAIKYE